VNLSGTAVASLEGVADAPAAEIRVTGNSTTSFQFVSATFLLAGNSNITIEYDSDLSVKVPAVRLYEWQEAGPARGATHSDTHLREDVSAALSSLR
jgi:hypothetical protein